MTTVLIPNISEDYSYLCCDVFVHCLWNNQQHRLLKCPAWASSSARWNLTCSFLLSHSVFSPSPFARRDCFFWSQSLVCGGDARACAPPAIKQTQAPPTKITTRLKAQQLGANPAPKFARSNRRQGPRDDRTRETQLGIQRNAQPSQSCYVELIPSYFPTTSRRVG